MIVRCKCLEIKDLIDCFECQFKAKKDKGLHRGGGVSSYPAHTTTEGKHRVGRLQ